MYQQLRQHGSFVVCRYGVMEGINMPNNNNQNNQVEENTHKT
jgi:hypothetical protein